MIDKNQKMLSVMLYDIYGKLLTEKQQGMFELFYMYDNSLAEIAEQYGVTRQAVLDCIKKAETTLNHFESKLKVLAKMQQAGEQIKNLKAYAVSNNLNEVSKIAENISDILGE